MSLEGRIENMKLCLNKVNQFLWKLQTMMGEDYSSDLLKQLDEVTKIIEEQAAQIKEIERSNIVKSIPKMGGVF